VDSDVLLNVVSESKTVGDPQHAEVISKQNLWQKDGYTTHILIVLSSSQEPVPRLQGLKPFLGGCNRNSDRPID
jgi:hypothetical protein